MILVYIVVHLGFNSTLLSLSLCNSILTILSFVSVRSLFCYLGSRTEVVYIAITSLLCRYVLTQPVGLMFCHYFLFDGIGFFLVKIILLNSKRTRFWYLFFSDESWRIKCWLYASPVISILCSHQMLWLIRSAARRRHLILQFTFKRVLLFKFRLARRTQGIHIRSEWLSFVGCLVRLLYFLIWDMQRWVVLWGRIIVLICSAGLTWILTLGGVLLESANATLEFVEEIVFAAGGEHNSCWNKLIIK